MKRLLKPIVLLLALIWAGPAFAAVQAHFHSFNGNVFWGRYPHTFVVLEGTLEATGERVNENYGFSARSVTPAILSGPVEHMVLAESAKNIRKTNRHFSITLSDTQYRRIVREVRRWKNYPGKYYDLEKRNCIHFVGKIAQLAGVTKVDYPDDMLRRPKMWLNYIGAKNPKLGAKTID
ncbi:MAG: hypothetical protein AAF127_07145 [Pseudomonadota bacterium]